MVNGLQIRLLIGFMVVLLVTLGVIGVVLILVLFARPVPVEAVYNDLAATSVQTNFATIFNERQNLRDVRPQDRRAFVESRLDDLRALLETAAAETDFRIIVLGGEQRVFYDSVGVLSPDDALRILERRSLRNSIVDNRRALFESGRLATPDGVEWLYVTRPILNIPRSEDTPQGLRLDYLVVAPLPEQTLQRVLRDFGDTFLLPLVQAGLVGLLVAIGFSFIITRSVVRPLAQVANAAERVAQGDYTQRVPVHGVTEARIVAQTFNEMTAQVQTTQQAQQDFLANVSHDLRTPLTSIQGFSQAIIDGVTDDPVHAATIINHESARLTRLVQDLLDIARIQSGRMQMLRQAVALDHVLRTVSDSLSIKAQASGLTLHVEVPNLPRIAGDGDRLAQVFTNLLDNALKHTPRGGEVWLIAASRPDGVLVTVRDTGEGIPHEDVSRIFERFYQVDKSRQRDSGQKVGTGLGLAIVAEIVRAHGGQIQVKSEVGVGTAFRVWLPQLSADHSTVIFRRH